MTIAGARTTTSAIYARILELAALCPRVLGGPGNSNGWKALNSDRYSDTPLRPFSPLSGCVSGLLVLLRGHS